MKTIKISEATHKDLQKIKAYYGYKTLSETIDICIDSFLTIDDRIERKEYDQSKK